MLPSQLHTVVINDNHTQIGWGGTPCYKERKQIDSLTRDLKFYLQSEMDNNQPLLGASEAYW